MKYTLVPTRDAGAGASAPQDLVALETEWATLIRTVIEARQHHHQVEAALFKAEIAASSASDGEHGAQVSVIDRAYLPQRPMLESADADVVCECADGVLIAARAAKSRRGSLMRAIGQLRPAPICGVVLLDA